MKTRLLILAVLVLAVLGGLYSCQDRLQDVDPVFSEDTIALSVDGEMKIAPGEQLLRIATAAARSMPGGENTLITNAYVERSGQFYYLFANAVKDGKDIALAIELVPKKPAPNHVKASLFTFANYDGLTDFEYEAGEKHSCSGNNCSSCSFTKNKAGGITGCDCNSTGSMTGGSSYCNHSVSN